MARVILYYGAKCPNCPQAKKVMADAATELGWTEGNEYELKDIGPEENMLEALTYQVASTPSFVIDGEALFVSGENIPSKAELIKAIKKE